MDSPTTIDYEGLRLATEEALQGRSRSQVARERHVSSQAVSAACNTANHGMTKLQIRLIEAYTDLQVTDEGGGLFKIARRQPRVPPEGTALPRRKGGHWLRMSTEVDRVLRLS